MLSTESLVILLVGIIFLLERFFAYRISLSRDRAIEMVSTEVKGVREDFIKLATLLQTFLMNVRFKDAQSELKSTDTQTLVSVKELEKLRDLERKMMGDYLKKVLEEDRAGSEGKAEKEWGIIR